MIRRSTILLAMLICISLNLQLSRADEDPAKQSDVTQKVISQLKDNKLVFTASNDVLGDPSSGDLKSLRIVYTEGDQTVTRLFPENTDINITPTPGQTLTVKKAVYGLLEGALEETAKVAAAVRDNALSISVDNNTMSGDPAFGAAKQLRVVYTVDGVTKTASANEGETLTIAKPDGGKSLVITQAIYSDPSIPLPAPTTAPAAAPQ